MSGAKQSNIDSLLQFAEETSDEDAATDARKLAKRLTGGEFSNLSTEVLQRKLVEVQLQVAQKQLKELEAKENLEARKCKGCGHLDSNHLTGADRSPGWTPSGGRWPTYATYYCNGSRDCRCNRHAPYEKGGNFCKR